MIKWVQEKGDDGIGHRSRGKTSNRRLSQKVKDKVLKSYRNQLAVTAPPLFAKSFMMIIKLS